MSQGADAVLSNRQRKILVKQIKAQKASEPRPEPAPREEFVKAEVRHVDEQIIPGLSGRGAILRADNLKKLLDGGKINAVQYCAGIDYVDIVETFFATASGFARADEMAGKVGGDGDPIRRYLKGRPARQIGDKVIGYIPTQRPRHPSPSRPASDGWTHDKLKAMAGFRQIAVTMSRMTKSQREALCILVIDPNRPYTPPLTISAATRRMFGYKDTAGYARLTKWLCEALDLIEPEIHVARRAMAA